MLRCDRCGRRCEGVERYILALGVTACLCPDCARKDNLLPHTQPDGGEGMTAVDHPDHYRKDTGHEAIDVIEAWGLGFSLGNAVKYIARAGLKGDAVEDLEKARWYIDREIERRRAQ